MLSITTRGLTHNPDAGYAPIYFVRTEFRLRHVRLCTMPQPKFRPFAYLGTSPASGRDRGCTLLLEPTTSHSAGPPPLKRADIPVVDGLTLFVDRIVNQPYIRRYQIKIRNAALRLTILRPFQGRGTVARQRNGGGFSLHILVSLGYNDLTVTLL